MNRIPITDLAAHVDALCAEHRISAEWVEATKKAWAIRRQRRIRIYPVINQRRYATALHEIGHIAGRRQSGRRIEQEWGAWEYALHHTLTDFTPATYRMILRSLSGYVYRYRRRAGAYLPATHDPFWEFLHKIATAAERAIPAGAIP